MSQPDRSNMHIGCPECKSTIAAPVPAGTGIDDESTSNRLQGTETACRNCGHELEVYYY